MAIKNYIFLNPTTNSYKIALQLQEYGKNVFFFNTKEFPSIKPNKVCSMYNSSYKFFSLNEGVSLKDDICLLTEKSIKNKLLFKFLKRRLRNINNSIACGDIVDLILHKRKVLLNSKANIDIKIIDSFLDVKPTSEDLIVCNKIPFVYVSKYINHYESLSIYETDIDTAETFGNIYYIFYIDDNRFELYIYNKFICIVHNINIKVDDILINKFNFLKKFKFKRKEYINIVRNKQPWLEYFKELRSILINDYSFGDISIKMPPSWYELVGRSLCTEN